MTSDPPTDHLSVGDSHMRCQVVDPKGRVRVYDGIRAISTEGINPKGEMVMIPTDISEPIRFRKDEWVRVLCVRDWGEK